MGPKFEMLWKMGAYSHLVNQALSHFIKFLSAAESYLDGRCRSGFVRLSFALFQSTSTSESVSKISCNLMCIIIIAKHQQKF
jgi:hypothetical protein